MGVDVASFGNYFADKRISVKSHSAELVPDRNVLPSNPIEPAQPAVEITVQGVPPSPASESKSPVSTRSVIPPKLVRSADEPIKCLVYNDPFGSTYKKYIFTADGKYLLGGMMIGDISDFVKLVAIVKKKVFPFLSLCSIAGFMLSYF
jgi:nitrite reductase (NAD(P)H)